MALGATADPDCAYRMYRLIAQELMAVGLNVALGPSADCNSNPHNSIIGMRSFGEAPELVARMTAAGVRGAHDGGAVATLKHFPGHGDTRLDSHRGLPTVDRSREDLLRIDLAPFAAGIAAGGKNRHDLAYHLQRAGCRAPRHAFAVDFGRFAARTHGL